MAFEPNRQYTEAIARANTVLIAFRKEWDTDAAATSVALAQILRKKGKAVDIAGDGFAVPKSLRFLPGVESVQSELRALQKFVVRLDTKRVGIESLSYDKKDTHLDIVLTPKGGQFDARDITTAAQAFKYDLIITVGSSDYGALGRIHAAHPDFFFNRPVINIDSEPSNEQYGNINAVDIAATSCAEIVYGLHAAAKEHFLEPDIATCLLAGIIAKTRSFKDARVTPRTLEVASELMAAGAKRNDIVQNLYRTRPLTTLRLWGRALARLKYDPEIKMAWTLLVRQDFIHAGASNENLEEVIDELISNSPEAEIIGVLYEQESAERPGAVESVCGLISSERHADALGLVPDLRPEGSRKLAKLCFPNTTLNLAEKTVLASIYRTLGKTPAQHSMLGAGAEMAALPRGMAE